MRRKSERNATKKGKSSPETKVEKVKRTRTSRRRKQSSSSENESADEGNIVEVPDNKEEVEVPTPKTPVKEDSPEEAQEPVWHVKTPTGSGEGGEIQKLKICLARPPSTPERAERSPRNKRKHSRATSSSDAASVEGVEEKRKSKHRSKKSSRESKEESEKSHDESHGEDQEKDASSNQDTEKVREETVVAQETPMSTTVETSENASKDAPQNVEVPARESTEERDTPAAADTTVSSPQQENMETVSEVKESVTEPHAEEKAKQQDTQSNSEQSAPATEEKDVQVSKVEESIPEQGASSHEDVKATNDNDVLELDYEEGRKLSTDSIKDKDVDDNKERTEQKHERSDSTQSNDVSTHNGQAPPIVVNRKRRWGSRPSKITTQKSITISTDILKEIIPDVKPAEFKEVIEEKKAKREVTEKLERPVLPKIVIDNTEKVEVRKEEKDFTLQEHAPVMSRKISIVKENDSITEHPPSPPRGKQSCILYITNLVRPFTLPQLKNLLQRTGKIVEDGFWIDKIKSRCFVKYDNEDQAVETRHALHGVRWPVSNPKTLQVDFSTDEAFEKARANEDEENNQAITIPGTVEDWLREQDVRREKDLEKPWEKKSGMREWDVGKGDKPNDEKMRRDGPLDKRRLQRSPEPKSPEPAKKFKKKEEEAPAKLLDDLFKKTKTTPCIYWLPLSAETIAVKEEQRRQHMAEHERRLHEMRRNRRH